jgi:hypothetical protein
MSESPSKKKRSYLASEIIIWIACMNMNYIGVNNDRIRTWRNMGLLFELKMHQTTIAMLRLASFTRVKEEYLTIHSNFTI